MMTAGQMDAQAWVWLARIRKAQGRKGEVLAEILTDFPEKFAERKRVWLLAQAGLAGESAREAVREIELRSHWLNKSQAGGVVLHFAGVDSITAAEGLRGLIVAIPRAERVALGEDEVYVGDLIGCVLVDVAVQPERAVGVIEDVDREAGPVALLVVSGAGSGEEILVPFAKAYLRRIDLEGKRVEMALPEGLVEVQLPEKPAIS
jgi:16S rRNA processing protein RimM